MINERLISQSRAMIVQDKPGAEARIVCRLSAAIIPRALTWVSGTACDWKLAGSERRPTYN